MAQGVLSLLVLLASLLSSSSVSHADEIDESMDALLVYNCFLQNGSSNFSLEDAEAYSFAGSLEVNDICSVGARAECARDDATCIGAGFRSFNATASSVFSNLSLGLNVRPAENLTIRPEVRCDWQDRDNSSDTPAFDDSHSAVWAHIR